VKCSIDGQCRWNYGVCSRGAVGHVTMVVVRLRSSSTSLWCSFWRRIEEKSPPNLSLIPGVFTRFRLHFDLGAAHDSLSFSDIPDRPGDLKSWERSRSFTGQPGSSARYTSPITSADLSIFLSHQSPRYLDPPSRDTHRLSIQAMSSLVSASFVS
jgi:hypothetical protein